MEEDDPGAAPAEVTQELFFSAAPRAVSFVLGEVPKLLLYTAIASRYNWNSK